MKENFLFYLLIDPLTKEPLIFDETTKILVSTISANEYGFVESIPQIILNENQSILKSDLHNKFDTEFKYRDHYQKDTD